jgi:WD40 repeat protein
MSTEDSLDDSFADLLATYESALLQGGKPNAPSPPPELKARLDDALRCVQALQQMWSRPLEPLPDETHERGNRYHLEQCHAVGGVGQVWLAQDAELRREVALKELLPSRANDAAFARRFLQEARITARLQHPGIVPVYELVPGDEGRPPFYTMRFVRGKTLTEAVSAYHKRLGEGKAGPLELNALLNAFVAVCNAVAYAHAHAIIHRDIKTANVVLGDFGEAVLIDWGFARELDRPEEPMSANGAAETGQSVAGEVVGTPAYMAPEQAAGQHDRIGRHTDIYGLGAILYEILTGRPPFAGKDNSEIVARARSESPPDPERLGRAVPVALAAVCKRALAREPAQRYASATALARDVERWLADEPLDAYPESLLQRGRRWARRHKPLVVGAVTLLITTFAALMIGLVAIEREQARTAEVRVQVAGERAAAEARAREQLENHLYIKRLALAERELAAHNLARATRLLAECPPERRGWEWDCLQRLCQTEQYVLRGHSAPVSAAVFCRDGTRIASAGHDHTIKLWDAATGKEVTTLPGHADVIHCMSVSPDGRRLASGSWDRTVKTWDADTGKLLQTLGGHPAMVIRVAFAPNGRWLAALSYLTVKLWDVDTGKEIRTIKSPSGIYGLAISPDGNLLATGGDDRTIRLWDPATGNEIRVLHGHLVPPKHLAFSPDGRLLAAGDGDTLEGGPGAVKIWDVATGKLVSDLEGHTAPVFSVAFSPDGRRLFTGGQDSSIKIWDVAHGQLMLTLHGHSDVVRSLAFSADGLRLATASSDRTVRVWDASPCLAEPSADTVLALDGHAELIIGVGFVDDGRRLASLSYDAVLKTWDTDRATALRSSKLGKEMGMYQSFAVSPREALLALGASNGSVALVNAETGTTIGYCPGYGAGPVRGVAFNGEGTRVAAAEWRGMVRIWDVKTRRAVQTLNGHTEPVAAVRYSPDNRLIASASHDQTVKIWDANDGRMLRTLNGHTSRLISVAFGPDSRLLASAGNDGLIKIWDTTTGNPLKEMRGHTAAVTNLVFSPDGRRLYSSSDDWTIKEWDVAQGKTLRTLRGHAGPVRTIVLAPGADRLASGSRDHTIRIWRLTAKPDMPQ